MTAVDLCVGTAGIVVLLLPGWLVARGANVPHPWLGGFVASIVAMVMLVFVLTLCGLPLTLLSIAAGWTLCMAGAAWFHQRNGGAAFVAPWTAARESRLLWLPLLPALAVVVFRATAQPLFGVDTVFRWNFLAEQMLAHGTLAFYPPADAADYGLYAWPDGIVPVVSTLYFWLYALAGAARPTITAPLVILQFVLLLVATHALTRRNFSPRAAVFACALVACSPVALWATAMGQETGLTAIALVTLLLYLPAQRSEETTGAVLFAGLAAGLGALAREYGLVLPLLGLAFCLGRRLSTRACLLFITTAAITAVPWYVRNAVLTGNPLFNLSLGGWFPVNEVHAWLNDEYKAEFGWSRLPPEAGRILLTNGLAALLGGAAGALLFARAVPALIVSIAVFAALWLASLGYTAAGFIYALRVLNPALALAAVLGGAALARFVPVERYRAGIAVALTLFAADSTLRALTLPANPYRLPPSEWLSVGGALHDYHARPIYREIARFAGGKRILVLGPAAQLHRQGARTLPAWSPEVRFLFDETVAPATAAQRLHAADIGFVLLTTGPANERFLARSRFFRDPGNALQFVWSDGELVLQRVRPGR